MVDHGEYQSVAMHLRARSPLAVGTKVRVGQIIGYVGSTGASSGPHLHFEIHHGRTPWSTQINPSKFLRAHGIVVRGC
jgi:murein DD-endopeptidase MepM/ murein hydrolase activator NlpD